MMRQCAGMTYAAALYDINVKKLQFMHMLTATDLRTSKTAKIKKLYYYITAHRHTSMCSRSASEMTYIVSSGALNSTHSRCAAV